MRKQTIQYSSPLDALIEVAKRLSILEQQKHMDSEDFFINTIKGCSPTMRYSWNGLTITGITCY